MASVLVTVVAVDQLVACLLDLLISSFLISHTNGATGLPCPLVGGLPTTRRVWPRSSASVPGDSSSTFMALV
jgi:hypothetical protein